jgi:hypothetical protein
MLDEKLKKFREDYRKNILPSWYSGKAHIIFTLSSALTMMFFGLSQINLNRPGIVWSLIPLVFLTNSVEYLAHRFILHRRIKFLERAYYEHTVLHHHFFTHEALEIETSRDFHRVLFSPFAVFFFIFIIGAPIYSLIAYLIAPDFGWMGFVTGAGYYLCYEIIHTICHLPDQHHIFMVPGTRYLKEFHRCHHDPSLMRDWNFNVLVPLSDRLFGSYRD